MGLVVSWAVIAQWSEHWQLKPETWVRFPVTTAFFLPECNFAWIKKLLRFHIDQLGIEHCKHGKHCAWLLSGKRGVSSELQTEF